MPARESAPGLNPLRIPLVVIVALLSMYGYAEWIAGTGGFPRTGNAPDATVHWSIVRWASEWFISWPMVMLLAVTLVAATIASGPRVALAAAEYSFDLRRCRNADGIARFWVVAARAGVWGGVGIAAVGAIAQQIVWYRQLHRGYFFEGGFEHEFHMTVLRSVQFLPVLGILVGRFVAGPIAAVALARIGSSRRVFTSFDDVALLGVLGAQSYALYGTQ